jgi:uncharacterized protein (TIRG00374 family)
VTKPDSSSLKSPRDARPKTGGALLKWLARLALGLLLVGVLIAWQGAAVRRALASASWPLLLGAVVFYLATQLLSALRWRVLLKAATRAVNSNQANAANSTSTPTTPSLLECCRIYLIGMFWNLWMPTAIGGDAMRAYLASRHSGNLPLAASSVLADRVTGFVALLLIGTAGFLIQIVESTRSEAGSGSQALRTLLLALVVLGVFVAVLAGARALAYRLEAQLHRAENSGDAALSGWKEKLARFWIKLHRALDVYLAPTTRGALLWAVLISLALQLGQIWLNIVLAHAVGLQLPIATFAWLVPSLAIAAMLPLGIGGLGVREAAAVALLNGATGGAPFSPGTIIAWSLLWQATLWLSALPGAVAHALHRDL